MDISKKDWKLFRERLSGWQENYMEGLVKEYANFLNDDKKPASEKFWEIEKRIKEDKRHPGVIMEMSKSEAIWDIVRLIRLKVITYDDLSDFSDELQISYDDKSKEIEKSRLEKYKVMVQTKCAVLKIKDLWNSSENNLYGIDKKRAIKCIPDIENYEYVPVNNSMLAKAEIPFLIFERNRGKCFIEMY